MTAPLIDRLREACNGHPHAKIPWPHRLLHEAAAEIERQAAELARLESQLAGLAKPAPTGFGDAR